MYLPRRMGGVGGRGSRQQLDQARGDGGNDGPELTTGFDASECITPSATRSNRLGRTRSPTSLNARASRCLAKSAGRKNRDGAPKEFDALILDRQADQIRTTISSPMFTKSTEIIDTLNLPKERADAVSDLAKKGDRRQHGLMAQRGQETVPVPLTRGTHVRAQMSRGMPFYSRTFARRKRLARKPGRLDARHRQAPECRRPRQTGIFARHVNAQTSHPRAGDAHGQRCWMKKWRSPPVSVRSWSRSPNASCRRWKNCIRRRTTATTISTLSPSAFLQGRHRGAKPEELQTILDDLPTETLAGGHPCTKGTGERRRRGRNAPRPHPGQETGRRGRRGTGGSRAVRLRLSRGQSRRPAQGTRRRRCSSRRKMPPALPALPPDDRRTRLRTAAHGAAEMALANWSSSLEQNIRGQVQGATQAKIVQQRLGNTNRYYFGQPTPKDQAIWKQAMKTDLTQGAADHLAGGARCPRAVQRRSRHAIPAGGV